MPDTSHHNQPERRQCRASVRVGCPDSPTVLVCHQPTPHPGLNHYDAQERIYWQRTDAEPWLLASPAAVVAGSGTPGDDQ